VLFGLLFCGTSREGFCSAASGGKQKSDKKIKSYYYLVYGLIKNISFLFFFLYFFALMQKSNKKDQDKPDSSARFVWPTPQDQYVFSEISK
jgi:hypothetical protein